MPFQPIRLAYNTHEPVTGTDENLAPILYLHGATASKESWEEIPKIVANATKRMSYSLDARNHGDSEWSDHFTFDVNVADLIHFMDNLGIKKAILVGHSMGGMTAIKTALNQAERVEKIVVEDMFVRKLPQEMTKHFLPFFSLMQQAVEKVPPEMEEDSAKKFILQHIMNNAPPELQTRLQAMKNNGVGERANHMALRRGSDGRYTFKCNLPVVAKALKDPETSSEPGGQFEGPAFFIYGKLSHLQVGADEHHIKQFFPNAVLEGVEDADHSIHTEKTDEFLDLLVKFLS